MYRLTRADTILRLSDGAFIPPDPGNADYQRYLADVAAGAEVEPPEPDPPLALAARSERKARIAARRGIRDGRS